MEKEFTCGWEFVLASRLVASNTICSARGSGGRVYLRVSCSKAVPLCLWSLSLPSSVAMAAHQRRTHAQLAVGGTRLGREGGRGTVNESRGLSVPSAAPEAHPTYQPLDTH